LFSGNVHEYRRSSNETRC